MQHSIIEGTLETFEGGKGMRRTAVFKNLVFRLKDGTANNVPKLATSRRVAEALKPGVGGKFYLFKAIDHSGMAGVRPDDGGEIYQFPDGNKIVFALVFVVGVASVALKLYVDGGIQLFGTALTVLGAVGFFYTQKGERDAKALFEADGTK